MPVGDPNDLFSIVVDSGSYPDLDKVLLEGTARHCLIKPFVNPTTMPSKRKRVRSDAPQVTIQESHPFIGANAESSHSTRSIAVPTQGDSRGRLRQVTEHSTIFNWDNLPDLSNLLADDADGDEEMPELIQDMVDDPPVPVVNDEPREDRETDEESVRRTVSELTSIVNISCIYHKI